jgi:hypothetical protein
LVILMIVSVALAIYVWSHFGVLWGLLVAFLMIGGFGWKLLLGVPGLFVRIGSRGASSEFIKAWEARAGEMRFGESSTYPPPGLYQAWRLDCKASKISAADWLDARFRTS